METRKRIKKIIAPTQYEKIGLDEYAKIIILQKIYDSGKATKYLIKCGQIINGCKVKRNSCEVWIPNSMSVDNYNYSSEKYVMVRKEFYDKMRFV